MYDDVAWVLDEPIVNFSQSIVDDSIRANAEFQYGSGMSPKIVRTSTGKCCDWCNEIVGVYDYEKVRDTGNKVFRRHRFCRCVVLFNPEDGRRKEQNVHSKKWRSTIDTDKIELRKTVGLGNSFKQRTANMEPSEYARDIVDEVLTEMFGSNWKELLGE